MLAIQYLPVVAACILLIASEKLIERINYPNLTPDARSSQSRRERITGKVVGVSDGDTFTLLLKGNKTVRVRLYGVDAPEKAQAFSTQAKKKVSALVFGKQVQVERKDKDRYGRLVGVVFVEKMNINEELLRAGYVWHYTLFDRTSSAWDKLEQAARFKERGLWADPAPEAPWEFRKERREAHSQ